MPTASTVFSQITQTVFSTAFARCVDQFPMVRSSRSFTAYDQFLALCFGQLTYRESLRDIVACLSARPWLQYRLGFRGKISRTNFAYANEHRDWRVFAAVAETLIRRACRLYDQDPEAVAEFPKAVFALDASIIHLSLNLFPWAFWPRTREGALKLHTLLSLRGSFPVWAAITEVSIPEMKMLDEIPIAAGAFYVMDRGYLDFTRLIRLHAEGAFFVVRSKRHVRFGVLQSRPVDKTTGLRCDQTIQLLTRWSRKAYSEQLRRIGFRDTLYGRSFVFLTNNFELSAGTVCELYKKRWQVELFFKWIKQHLRIRNFFGRSPNAVRSQVWTALCSYLMVAIAKKEMGIEKSLYQILQIISVSALEEIPLKELLAKTPSDQKIDDRLNGPDLLGF